MSVIIKYSEIQPDSSCDYAKASCTAGSVEACGRL